MKEILGLLFGVCLTVIIVYLAATKQIETKLTITFLAFAVLGGLGIANFDVIKRVRWRDVELETYERRVEDIKSEALQEIERTVDDHKESIRLLMSTLNDTREAIDAQKAAVDSLLERIAEQEAELATLNSDADSTRQRIETLHQASSDLALLLTKITWLQAETRSEFGTERATAALEQIVAEVNNIVQVVIPDAAARSRWIQQLRDSLPARNQ